MDKYRLSRDTDLVIEHLLHRLTTSVCFLDVVFVLSAARHSGFFRI